MKRRHLILSFALGFLLIFNILCSGVEVSANSAPSHWTGTTSAGTIVRDDNCPITVEKENLIFDIPNFPDMYSEDYNGDSYSAKVSAEYTFHNPTNQSVNATLVFPFGELPEYYKKHDVALYDVLIDGNPIEASLRHTYIDDGEAFNLDDSLLRLKDEMMENDLYKRDTVVSQYSFEIAGNLGDLEEYPDAMVSMQLKDLGAGMKLVADDVNGVEIGENQVTLEYHPEDGHFSLDVIGGELASEPEILVYSDSTKEKQLGIETKLSSLTATNLEQYLLLNYDSSLSVSETDWYNASFTYLNIIGQSDTFIEYDNLHQIDTHLMQWYVYDISIEPEQTITNTVTAPLYPEYFRAYSSPTYTYTYLLSPAKEWADFHDLNIVVNTPYYIIRNSLGEMDQTEAGFTMHFDSLPDKELVFQLCEESNPTSNGNFGLILKVFGGIVIGLVALVVLVIVIIVKLLRRKS